MTQQFFPLHYHGGASNPWNAAFRRQGEEKGAFSYADFTAMQPLLMNWKLFPLHREGSSNPLNAPCGWRKLLERSRVHPSLHLSFIHAEELGHKKR